ncbi:hypothetical protein A1O3_05792 [Capronia epimyces CBS 606.96]|uniref:Uncharacterized protein n=1 Tax=Capronia epimyces CBS 606.96 TaxID=1182542 RepID=W9XX20_9EURO|nr:uncharacterized protein A1O3_05792 [Capronia epimyces CBS 606.96]EXJ85117.1 hypothetical protein A1O3_05792 [Capronia epimyces CBS 606.96]
MAGATTGKIDPAKQRSTNEKITDKARGLFEKATGKDVPDKFSSWTVWPRSRARKIPAASAWPESSGKKGPPLAGEISKGENGRARQSHETRGTRQTALLFRGISGLWLGTNPALAATREAVLFLASGLSAPTLFGWSLAEIDPKRPDQRFDVGKCQLDRDSR